MIWLRLALSAILAAAITGCSALPRDPDGTLDRICAEGVVRIGVGAGPRPREAAGLIAALARATGASPRFSTGALEPMIVALDADRLDVVIAPVASRTPWKTQVAMGPPIAVSGAGDARIEWRALMKNGENRWIMLVEKAARPLTPAAAQ